MSLVADLSGLVALVGATYNITRYTPASPAFVNGLAVASTTSTVPITASIQPLSGEQLKANPELRSMSGALRLFTGSTLNVGDGQPDRLTYQGVQYEVSSLLAWHEAGGYGEYVITRREARS